MEGQIRSPNGADLGLLHMCGSCVASSICGTPSGGSGACP